MRREDSWGSALALNDKRRQDRGPSGDASNELVDASNYALLVELLR